MLFRSLARFRAPAASCPTVGANCRGIIDKYSMDGTSRRGERRGVCGDGVIGTRLHELPRFALPNGGGETTSCKIDYSNRCTGYKVVVVL